MLLPLRHPRIWLAIGWIVTALTIIASLVPVQDLPKPPAGINDKMEHFIAYALLSIWFAGIYPRSRYAIIAVGLFLLGIAIEIAQGAMHWGREADVYDVIANTVGIVAGMTLALLWLGGWAQRVESWSKRP